MIKIYHLKRVNYGVIFTKEEFNVDRRVAIVKGNYIVIILFTGLLKEKFVTAFEKEDYNNILSVPDFERSKKYFGDDK